VVVELDGELDQAVRDELDAQLRPLARSGRALVLDAARLVFCSAGGLGLFLELRDEARAAGGSVALHAPAAGVRRLLALTGLHEAFPLTGEPGEQSPEPGGEPRGEEGEA
jgi:anti-sigma B factor antagonist